MAGEREVHRSTHPLVSMCLCTSPYLGEVLPEIGGLPADSRPYEPESAFCGQVR